MDTESQGLHRRAAIKERGNKVPGFYFFRIVWVNPTMQRLAAEKGIAPAQLAIAWVLAKDEHIVPIIGARTRKQLAESLRALQVELSSADLARIEQCVPATAISGTRYDEHQMRMLDSERTGP
jgi:aryl-alcohol dehydrogenase-like predicted oxidoreductase